MKMLDRKCQKVRPDPKTDPDDDHLLTVARYVEGNPVRAGLVETAGVVIIHG